MSTGRRPSTELARLNRVRNNTDTTLHTVGRESAASSSALTAGTVYLSMFTPLVDVTTTKIAACAGTVAWTGNTLIRLGLYRINDDGTATLVAATANDLTLFATVNIVFSAALDTAGGLPARYRLLAGQRYAVGVLGVGGTVGALRGALPHLTIATRKPILAGTAGTGQADLPVGPVAVTAYNLMFWAELSS